MILTVRFLREGSTLPATQRRRQTERFNRRRPFVTITAVRRNRGMRRERSSQSASFSGPLCCVRGGRACGVRGKERMSFRCRPPPESRGLSHFRLKGRIIRGRFVEGGHRLGESETQWTDRRRLPRCFVSGFASAPTRFALHSEVDRGVTGAHTASEAFSASSIFTVLITARRKPSLGAADDVWRLSETLVFVLEN